METTQTTEKAYTTKEVSVMLDMPIPTVRKYAQSLESLEYKFIRSESNARVFVEKDIMAIRYFKDLREKTNVKVEQVANIVVEKFGKGAIQDVMPVNTEEQERYSNQYNELKEMISQQNQLIKGLSDQLDKQQHYIEDKIEQRDQQITQLMNKTMANKKQLEEPPQKQDNKEVEEQEQENKKKGFFSRLFNK
ncbi:hypothetical protein [Halobacillus ihumii]|uniref:hypothetical protein n=1 Tax=Halobacillus ihumii TaxID=2686092 RepID=UPI0013D0C440|nr:hypothetical protein [Halobacillus ihumii]